MSKRALLSVKFCHECRGLTYPHALLVRTARQIYSREGIDVRRTTNVILVTDYRIRRLNAAYRGKDRVTDVLSFPFDEDDLLGEIYISLPRCRAQARGFGLTYAQEVLRIFVHGVFHLLGYDHETAADRRRMENREQRYCRLGGIGVGPS